MSTNQSKQTDNSYFMNLALKQAHRVLGNTKNNPAVGCVITKNGQLISAASTSLNGRPHAEHNAINFSNHDLTNSNIYITLEPCSNYGKTHPCVKKIINNKIKKVFFSVKDPDVRSYNKSQKQFKKKGVKVNIGICSHKLNDFYNSYFKSKTNNLPFVTAKIATSKDFFTLNKKNKWITNIYSRGRVHLMRSYHDCIISSYKTLSRDNSLLTCRIKGLENRSPTRIILDSKLKISLKSKILKDAIKYPTFIFYNKFNEKKINLLKKLKVKTFKISNNFNGDLNLKSALIKIKNLGFSRIFLEVGANLISSFLNDNLVDDFKIFISSKKLGKNGKINIKKHLNIFLKDKKKTIEKVNLLGDKLISYKLK